MATSDEMRRLLQIEPGSNLRDRMIEELSEREQIGKDIPCDWCGTLFKKRKRNQKFCAPKCRCDFHNHAVAVLKSRAQLDQS